MTITNLQHKANISEAPKETGSPSGSPVLRQSIKKYPCSACGTQWSSPRVHKGTRHRSCNTSPAGRFGVQPLSEKKPEKA